MAKKLKKAGKTPVSWSAAELQAALSVILDKQEVAELLGVSASRVDQLATAGRLTTVKRWAKRLFLRSEVEAFAKQPRLPGVPGHGASGE